MKSNQLTMKVSGKYALFTDPMTKISGEKSSLMIPTYEALKGIVESSYWKPCLRMIITEVKILNPIRTERKGMRPIKYDGGNDLAYYTYLSDVSYLVTFHFEWNQAYPELKNDWNENKHFFVAKRALSRGGRRDIYLGTRECQAYIEEGNPEEKGYYDNAGMMDFGLMFHSFSYPEDNGKEELNALFWYPKMENGVIRFCRPEECEKKIFIRKMKPKKFVNKVNYTCVADEVCDGGGDINGIDAGVV